MLWHAQSSGLERSPRERRWVGAVAMQPGCGKLLPELCCRWFYPVKPQTKSVRMGRGMPGVCSASLSGFAAVGFPGVISCCLLLLKLGVLLGGGCAVPAAGGIPCFRGDAGGGV